MQSLFFDEAQRHLHLEAGRTSLATAQALLLMHLSSAAMGADRASRMHQLCAGDMFNNLLTVEVDVTVEIRDRKIMSKALWGMYCFERLALAMLLVIVHHVGSADDFATAACSPLPTFVRPFYQNPRFSKKLSTKPPKTSWNRQIMAIETSDSGLRHAICP